MKNLLILFSLILSTTLYAQGDAGGISGTTVTLREIAPVWPGCEGVSLGERDACFKKKLITTMTTIEKLFDESPKDIQMLILSKIVYAQPEKLLEAIRIRESLRTGLLSRYTFIFKSIYCRKYVYSPAKNPLSR